MPQDGRQWTVVDTLDWTRGYLESHGDEHPRLSAEWLLSAATGLSRVELYLYHDRPLNGEERSMLRGAVKRRAAGEPLQYVTGEMAFRHIVVRAEPGVLIPRPETEMLVEYALELLGDAPKILEPCTGTGCIACSFAKERQGATVVATDISPVAVDLARRNVAALGLEEQVQVLECDLDEGVDPTCAGTFDALVSNPPYIPSGLLAELPREVADFEPRLALDGGEDGLAFLPRLMASAKRFLRPGGVMALELHDECLQQAADLCRQAGFAHVEVKPDLTGRDRVLLARMGE